MKHTIFILFFISFCIASCNEKNGGNEIVFKKIPRIEIPQKYVHIFKGKMVDVEADSILFIGEHDSTYFVHFIIYNISADTIGVNLADYWKTIYCNLWGFIDTTSMCRSWDGPAYDYKLLTDSEKIELKKNYSKNKIQKISPGDSLEYYDNFWDVADVNKQGKESQPKCPFFAIELNGRLSFTDGKSIEDFYLGFDKAAIQFSELDIRWPIVAKPIPVGAILSKR